MHPPFWHHLQRFQHHARITTIVATVTPCRLQAVMQYVAVSSPHCQLNDSTLICQVSRSNWLQLHSQILSLHFGFANFLEFEQQSCHSHVRTSNQRWKMRGKPLGWWASSCLTPLLEPFKGNIPNKYPRDISCIWSCWSKFKDMHGTSFQWIFQVLVIGGLGII